MQVHLHTCFCSVFQHTYLLTITCTSLSCYFSFLLKSSVVWVTVIDLILILFTSLMSGGLESSDMDFWSNKHFGNIFRSFHWEVSDRYFGKKKKKETRIYVDNEIVFWIIKYLKPIKITLFLSEKWWWAQILNALTKSLIFTSFLSIDYVRNCIIGKGADYKGTISITKSGIQCQAWNSMIPHEHR